MAHYVPLSADEDEQISRAAQSLPSYQRVNFRADVRSRLNAQFTQRDLKRAINAALAGFPPRRNKRKETNEDQTQGR
jgi:hypothetical protein